MQLERFLIFFSKCYKCASVFLQICKEVPPYEGKFGEKDWNSLDASYRVIADHTRTITVCLADGMIPEQKYCFITVFGKAFKSHI